jgi:PKD repeat protein
MSANISFDITGVCVSDSCTPYVSYSGNITSYAWNFGDPASGADNLSNVSNPFHIYNNTGLYVVTLIISDGVIADTFQKFVTVVDCRVWPGDGNRDGEVNGDDLLPLGIYYGLAGTVRAGAASTWTPQPAADWAGWQSFMYLQDLVNSKHADCDGNGVIDSLDMDVISQNFGMKHGSPNNRSAMLFVRPSDPLLGFEDTTYSSQHFLDIPLLLTGGDSVSGIYGISATILYDITALNTSTINVDFANSWLGNEGVDMIALWDNDEVAGMLSISMVRTDKTKKKGIGEVARISAEFLNYGTSFTVLEVAPWSKVISNGQYSYQNNQQVSVPVNLGGVQLLHTSGIEKTSDMRNSFGIYPNPATNTIALSGDLSTVTTFEITDIRGAKIMTVPITSINNGIIDISELSSGVYLLRISDYAGISTLKFVKF